MNSAVSQREPLLPRPPDMSGGGAQGLSMDEEELFEPESPSEEQLLNRYSSSEHWSGRRSSSWMNLLQQGSQTFRWNWSNHHQQRHRRRSQKTLAKHIRSITRASHHTAAVVRLQLVQLASGTGSRLAIATAFVAESVDGVFDLPKTLYNSPARQKAYILWHKFGFLRHANLVALVVISIVEVPLWCLTGGFNWQMHLLWGDRQECMHNGKPLYISGIPFLSIELAALLEGIGLLLISIDFGVHVWWSGGISWTQLLVSHFRTNEARDYTWLTLLKGVTIVCSVVEWLVFVIMGPKDYADVFRVRLGHYLRLCLICLYSRHIRTNLRVIFQMMPNFLEVVLLLVLFVFFCAWIGLVGYRDSTVIGASFYDIWESSWSLLVLLTTSNNPSLWISAYDAKNLNGLFFLFYLLVGVLCISPLLLSVVVNTYMRAMAKLLVTRVIHRDVVLNAAFDILDTEKEGRVSIDRWRELHGLYMRCYSMRMFAHVDEKCCTLTSVGSLDVNALGEVEEIEGHIALRVQKRDSQMLSSGDLNQPLIQSMINKTIDEGESFEFERDGSDEGTSLWRSIDGDAGLTHLENYGSETISLKEFKSLCSNLPLFSGKYSGSALRRQKTSFLRGRFAKVRSAWRRLESNVRHYAKVLKQALEIIVGSSCFESIVYLLLAINFVMLIVETGRNEGWQTGKGWVTGNLVVSGLFIVEILMRIGAYGFGEFWEMADNRINLILSVVVFSAQAVLISVGEGKSAWYEIASMAQLLRFVRVIARVSRYQRILYTLSLVAGPLSRLAAVIFCFLYLFSLIGMECFGAKIYNDIDCKYSLPPPASSLQQQFDDSAPIKKDCFRGNPLLNGTDYASESYYALNFNDMGSSLLTVFNLLFVNDWYVTVAGFVAVMQSRWARIYFVIFYVIVVCALVNVAVAMMLQAFAIHIQDGPDDQALDNPSMSKVPTVSSPRSSVLRKGDEGVIHQSDRSGRSIANQSNHTFTYFNRKASDYMDVMSIVLKPEVEKLCQTTEE